MQPWIKLRRCAACSIANGTPETRLQPRYAGSRGTGEPYQRAFKSNVQTIAYGPARAGPFILLSRFGAVNATRSRFDLTAKRLGLPEAPALLAAIVVRVGREH